DSVASSQLLGRLAGQPLELAFAVHDPAAPAIRLNIRTLVDLDQAAALGLLPDSLAAQGRLGVDLAVRAPVLAPARGTVDGTVQFDGVTVTTPALEQPVAIEGGRLVFDGQRVRGEELQIQAGESDVALDLTVNDWLPFALGDSTAVASASFDARSRLLDLDALLGTPDSALYSKLFFARLADRPVDGRPVDEIAEEAGLGLPPLPPIRLDGRLRAYTLRRNGLELQDVDVRVAGRGDRIELTDARFNLMGGGVQVSGRIGIPAGTPADGEAGFPTVLTYQLRDVGAAPFFNTLTPFRDHLTGSLLMGGTARMVLDEYLLPRRESLTAEGTLAVNGGQLANWTVLSALAERLGLPQFDTLTFHDWTGGFQVAGPQIALTESVIASDEVQVRTAGSFDFAGRLNLTATLLLDPAVAERMRADVASRLTGAVAGPEGRIPLGVRITGPATEPELALDFSRAAENALAKARAEAQERVEAAAAKALDGAVEQLLPQRDSLSTAADSARARVEKEVKSRLCKIIKCD
ncbi:MAG TPA: AsmA-like C-terminal region-containing protein, partial [Longimicrobiales bacterium]